MNSYAPDFWQVYGVNALDVWDLDYFDFLAMTQQIDEIRREAANQSHG